MQFRKAVAFGMKLSLPIILLLLPFWSHTQLPAHNFFEANDKIKNVRLSPPDSLARLLTAPYSKDIDKVKSIFRWIAENITYNDRPWRNSNRNYTAARIEEDENDTGALKPLTERVALDVLKKRIAFCDGYARLFTTLCNYAGIKSEVIAGYGNGGMGRRLKFTSNHRWNAVYIDSAWHLLDVTWASGYVTYSSRDFIQHYNDYYFFTPAKDFIRDHYPEDPQWSLLPDPPAISEFKYSPFKSHAYHKNNIISYSPQPGIIEAAVGDTISFTIESEKKEKRMSVSDTFFLEAPVVTDTLPPDSSVINLSATNTAKKMSTFSHGNFVTCRYIVSSPSVEWLHVILNDEMIFRYKLNIRKNDMSAK